MECGVRSEEWGVRSEERFIAQNDAINHRFSAATPNSIEASKR